VKPVIISSPSRSWVIHILVESLGLLEQVRLLELKRHPKLSDTARAIEELLQECETAAPKFKFGDDLLASLREVQICFDSGCYIACMALCGKLLEIALKHVLMERQIDFDDKCMIGKLLALVRGSGIQRYIDPSLDQIAEIINRSRIPAVHAKEKVPVPSREQAAMVINAMMDTVRRTLV
jgi:hypothetical protein